MKIISTPIPLSEVEGMLGTFFDDMVKGVVDVNQRILALDANMHADLERVLLERGSQQVDLWGINIYPQLKGDELIEFDSIINIRPCHGNRTRGVDSIEKQNTIIEIVKSLIQ